MTCNNINTYVQGDCVRLQGAFTDIDGAPIDPSSETVLVKTPDGVVTSYVPTKLSIGIYYYDFTITQSGTHYWRMSGAGNVIAAAEDMFQVSVSYII